MALGNKLNKAKHIDKLQQAQPYEAPINVRQIGNLPYGDSGLQTDYYEPMALTRGEASPDKRTMHVAIVLHDDPYGGTRYTAAPIAMEMARRGMAVFVPSLTPADAEEPFFMRQLADVLSLLADVTADRQHLDLHPATYAHEGNKVVLVGCGTGAILAGVVMRLHHDARMRDYFAAKCPMVRTYFGMGDTPTVDFDPLLRIEGLVSMSGDVYPPRKGIACDYTRWLGASYTSTKLYSYLDLTRWVSPDYPPILLVVGGADTTRDEALIVHDAISPIARVRLLDLPREDSEGHLLENLFWARYPLWERSKEVNSQIVTSIRNL